MLKYENETRLTYLKKVNVRRNSNLSALSSIEGSSDT